jgi:hypothetical protein
VPKFLATIRRKEKEIKEIKTGKKEMKWSLLIDDTILYLKYPKDSTKE